MGWWKANLDNKMVLNANISILNTLSKNQWKEYPWMSIKKKELLSLAFVEGST